MIIIQKHLEFYGNMVEIANFTADNATDPFNIKRKIIGQRRDNGTKR